MKDYPCTNVIIQYLSNTKLLNYTKYKYEQITVYFILLMTFKIYILYCMYNLK